MPTLTVACKLPNGLMLDLKGKRPVKINGPVVPWGVPPKDVGGGYALTHNVDADFFNQWLKVYAESDMVRKKFIFASPADADVRAQAREMANEKTGLEPIDPDKPGPGLERVSG